MSESVTVTLPLPPKALSLNARSRSHWPRTNATKQYRRAAADAGTVARCQHAGPSEPFPWRRATIQPVFYVRDRRGLARDGDGAAASLKPAIDGLQVDRSGVEKGRIVSKPGAGIVENDHGVTLLPPVFEVDKAEPRVELVITPIPEAAA